MIQALDRLQPVLPLSPGRMKRHGFECCRHGTVSLLAALNTQTGAVGGQTVPGHTSAVFVDFLAEVGAVQPRAPEIHVILDNLSTHETRRVAEFLAAHPRVHLHFTPTYASWLNQQVKVGLVRTSSIWTEARFPVRVASTRWTLVTA